MTEADPAAGWSSDPPDSEGLWWIYGDEEFGAMGGHYTGACPLEAGLGVVEVIRLGGGVLYGSNKGRLIGLTPFDLAARKPGYVGLWRKVDLPPLPPPPPSPIIKS